jgi:hypothetical protein
VEKKKKKKSGMIPALMKKEEENILNEMFYLKVSLPSKVIKF